MKTMRRFSLALVMATAALAGCGVGGEGEDDAAGVSDGKADGASWKWRCKDRSIWGERWARPIDGPPTLTTAPECVIDPKAEWDIVVESGQLHRLVGDPRASLDRPDLFTRCTIRRHDASGEETEVITDTTVQRDTSEIAEWNETVCRVTGAELLAERVSIELYDSDLIFNDRLGSFPLSRGERFPILFEQLLRGDGITRYLSPRASLTIAIKRVPPAR